MTRYRTAVTARIPYTALASPETLQPHCVDRWWPHIGDRTVTTTCENGMVVIRVERDLDAPSPWYVLVAAVSRFDVELDVSGLLRRGVHPERVDVHIDQSAPVRELAAA